MQAIALSWEQVICENDNVLLGQVTRSLVSARKLKVESLKQITCNYFVITHESDKTGRYQVRIWLTAPQILLSNSPDFVRKTQLSSSFSKHSRNINKSCPLGVMKCEKLKLLYNHSCRTLFETWKHISYLINSTEMFPSLRLEHVSTTYIKDRAHFTITWHE